MSIYITQRNNARFFSQFHAQLKPICDAGTPPIIAYAPKKGFRIEKKTDHYSLTRLFISCWGPSYRFEDTTPPLEERLTSTLRHRLENPEDKTERETLCQELIAAVKVCEKLTTIAGHILSRRKEKKSEFDLCKSAGNKSMRFHMRQFDLLRRVAELKTASPLSVACQNGLFDMALELIDQGADPAGAHGFYDDLLKVACKKDKYAFAIKLIELGAHPSCAEGHIAKLLHTAISQKNERASIKIIHGGAPLDELNTQRETALLAATRLRLSAVVAQLLEKNADTSKADAQGNTPMHVACIDGSIELTSLFTAKKACNFAQLNRSDESPFQAGLSSSNWNTHKPLMQQFFQHFFKDLRAAKERIEASGNHEFCKYFTQNPSPLVDPRLDGPTANPLEIPLLLQNGRFLKALSAKLTRRKFMELVTAFSQKYPGTPADLVTSIYSMTRSGLTKGIEKVNIPPKPAGFEVRDLMTLYEQINFQNPKQPDYYNTAKFSKDLVTFDETGKPTFATDLRSHLELYVKRVEKREYFKGAPKEGSQALLDMHTTLEKAVANICKKLHDIQVATEEKRLQAVTDEDIEEALKETAAFKKLRASTVIEFLRIAGFCAGKYMSTTVKQFNRVVRNIVLTFENLVQESGGDYREILFSSLVTYRKGYGIDVHDEIQLIRAIGKELGIPGAEALASFPDPHGTPPSAYQLTQAKKKFFELLTPTTFINEWLEPQIRTEIGMRNKFINWCKNNVPVDWAKERFDPIRREVKAMQDAEGATEEDIETFLLKHEIYLGFVDERKITPEEAIENERVGCFLGLEVVVDMEAVPMRIKKTSIAYMLETMGLIAATFAKEPVVNSRSSSSKATSLALTSDEPPTLIKFVLGLGSRVWNFLGL